MSVALLVDANFSASPLKSAIEASANTTFTLGRNPQDVLARGSEAHICADYADESQFEAAVTHLAPSFLVPGCNDVSYEACCRLNEAMGHKWLALDDIETIEILHRKDKFRDFCRSASVCSPRRFADIKELSTDDFPVIVKPADAYSGRGVSVVDQRDENLIRSAISHAQGASRTGNFVVEQYVEGQLYSFSAFLTNSDICQAFLVKEYCFANPFVVDISHVVTDRELEQLATEQAKKIARGLGLCSGLLHIQFILRGSTVYIIEVTRRCPGDLYATLIELSTGFNYGRAYVQAFLGEPIGCESNQDPRPIVRYTVSEPLSAAFQGCLFHPDATVEQFYPLLCSGDRPKNTHNDRVALAFFACQDLVDVDDIVHMAKGRSLVKVLSSG